MPKMIVDKKDLVGENAWAKLLPEEKDKKSAPVIVKMSNSTSSNNNDSKQTTPLNVDQLVAAATTPGAGSEQGGPASALEDTYKRTATYASNINSTGGESSGSGTQLSRKESLLGSFHRQIRRSIKAVSESPGPLTR